MSIGKRNPGTPTAEEVARLLPPRRQTGRLATAEARDPLPASRAEAIPSGAAPGGDGGGGGAVTVTPYSITSSDGLFVLAGFKATDGDFYAEEPPVV